MFMARSMQGSQCASWIEADFQKGCCNGWIELEDQFKRPRSRSDSGFLFVTLGEAEGPLWAWKPQK